MGLVWFGLVCFYGISAIVGHLMPNPFDTYIKYTINIFKWAWAHFSHIKWFHLFLSYSNTHLNLKRFYFKQFCLA